MNDNSTIDNSYYGCTTPQHALWVAECRSVSKLRKKRCSDDERREIINACREHEGADVKDIISRWENFKNIAEDDLWQIAKAFNLEMNGCGTAGWKGALVPNRPPTMLWLVSWAKACNLHDIIYGIGGDWVIRLFADLYFLRKMKDTCRRRLIITRMLGLRWGERTADLYYWYVRMYGKKFFKSNPPKPKKEVIV